MEKFQREIPEKCGVSSEWILSFTSELAKQLPNQVPHGWALYRHGKQLAKAIYKPFDDTTPQMVCSISKSFVSTAIGFCVQEGLLKITDRVCDYFPDKLPKELQKEMAEMTVETMLCMGVGQEGTPVHEPGIIAGEDKLRDFFATPIVHTSGTVFGYNGKVTHTLAALVNRVTGMDIMDYLNDRFFSKVGMPVPPTPRYPSSGLIWGESGMRFTQEEIATLGQFYLNKGMWNSEQILSREWCELASEKHIDNKNCGTGLDWQEGYCFQFWRGRFNTFRFCGAYAQFCIVMPELDALFVYQSGTDNDKIQWVVPIFYDCIMSKMSAEINALPENPKAYEMLSDTLSNLKENAIYSEKSPLEAEICKQQFTENLANLKDIAFDFADDTLYVDATLTDGFKLRFPAGRRDFALSDGVIDSKFCHMDDCDHSRYASTFYWEQPNHLIVTSHLLASMTMVKIDATFTREGASISLNTIRGKLDKKK